MGTRTSPAAAHDGGSISIVRKETDNGSAVRMCPAWRGNVPQFALEVHSQGEWGECVVWGGWEVWIQLREEVELDLANNDPMRSLNTSPSPNTPTSEIRLEYGNGWRIMS